MSRESVVLKLSLVTFIVAIYCFVIALQVSGGYLCEDEDEDEDEDIEAAFAAYLKGWAG